MVGKLLGFCAARHHKQIKIIASAGAMNFATNTQACMHHNKEKITERGDVCQRTRDKESNHIATRSHYVAGTRKCTMHSTAPHLANSQRDDASI